MVALWRAVCSVLGVKPVEVYMMQGGCICVVLSYDLWDCVRQGGRGKSNVSKGFAK